MVGVSKSKAGVAIFDDPANPLEGWCALNGEEARRFSSPSMLTDMSPGAFWVVNVPLKGNTYKNNQFDCVSHLRKPLFLKPSIDRIIYELGYDPRSMDARDIAKDASTVIYRAWDMLQETFPGLKPADTAQQAIAEICGFKERLDKFYSPIFESAYQDGGSIPRDSYQPGFKRVTLILNRVRHAHKVLSIPFPNPKSRLEHREGNFSLKEIILADKPLMAKCEIKWGDAKYADLCAVGVPFKGVSSPYAIREWFYLPELILLSQYASSIKVMAVIEWEKSQGGEGLPARFVEDELTSLSYSAGIAAETVLASVMDPGWSSSDRKMNYSMRSGWYKAIDRVLTFPYVRMLVDNGVRVSGYRGGSVTVLAMDHEMEELASIAADCGFQIMVNKKDE